MTSLQDKLQQIFIQALEDNWWQVEDDFKELAKAYIKQRPFQIDRAVSDATTQAISIAAERHIETTFASAMSAIAKAQAHAHLAKRLKARGLSTSLLDEWKPLEPGSEA